MTKKSSRVNASGSRSEKRASVTSSAHADSLERAWIDAEVIWKATEPLSGSVTAARVAGASASPTSPAFLDRHSRRSGSGRLSGSAPSHARALAEEPHTPSSQLLSQQPHHTHAFVSSEEAHAGRPPIATALFTTTDATMAAKPLRRRPSLNGLAPKSSVSPLSQSTSTGGGGGGEGEGSGGALSSSPSDGSARGSRGAGSMVARDTRASVGGGSDSRTPSARWSPHDITVRAMLHADPPTATRAVELKRGYTMPSPQTPLWSQFADAEEDEEEDDEAHATVQMRYRQPASRGSARHLDGSSMTATTATTTTTTAAAMYAMAAPSIALVSGDSELYPTVHHAARARHDEDEDVVVEDDLLDAQALSLTQEALAIDAQASRPYDAPLMRRRGSRTRAPGSAPPAEVEWTVSRTNLGEEAEEERHAAVRTGATRRPGKRSRSSVALVGHEGGGAYSTWADNAAFHAHTSSLASPYRNDKSSVEAVGLRTTSLSSSQQRRLQSWAAQQRQFFHFIDARDIVTVGAAEAALEAAVRKQKKAGAAAAAAAAAATHTTARASVSRASPHALKKPPLLLASRLGGSSTRPASVSHSVSRGPSAVATTASVSRVAPRPTPFAQFVTNVKKRGTTSTPSSSTPARAGY